MDRVLKKKTTSFLVVFKNFMFVYLSMHFFVSFFLNIFLTLSTGTLYWRACNPPFHNALEKQYCQMVPVQTFSQLKSNGKEVSWTHDLFLMLQTNHTSGQTKRLRRIRTCAHVPSMPPHI